MDLEQRLRAARPRVPDADPDPELLARVMAQPVERRRRRPVAVPAVAVAALVAAAVVLLAGNRPDTASAISQAMHWFDPPAGSVLHSVMVDASGQTREFWVQAGDPERSRTILPGGYETGPGAVYDPATDTIYTDDGTRKPGKGPDPKADAAKRAQAARGDAGSDRVKPPETLPSGDPLIAKVRVLIDLGHAAVIGREVHDGVDAWRISLTDTADRAAWSLWVRADDGRPLAIDDPGDPARGKAPERSRWTRYEVLDRAGAPLTLREAHPAARLIADGARYDALIRRIQGR